ncbi:hypothetical protein M378DRAFT_66805 [Amanita muscaria Koide BX008]|uniref:Uncharacterized protein n=1 Tax=Amanita muscaria (strain Koide BX008) TaxID=946122 RepID=A0A0C2XN77_AMAMK|nr:hypothetical protein M378DRAFT_66805 [Amanita muscaria Koide BX008]
MEDRKQVEHEQISTSLEVEQLDSNLFRSKSLYLPVRARGVFGGQVISQAVVTATNVVDPGFALHVRLQCYFLASGSPSTPIIYNVEVLRKGRSYIVCTVKAIQMGNVIFTMTCSFQKPEPWQPSQQWPMPNVPAPEQCPPEEERILRLVESQTAQNHPRRAEFYRQSAAHRSISPIAIRCAKAHDVGPEGTVRYMWWMKAKGIPKYEAPFQKCIVAYMSDIYFIYSARLIMGLKRFGRGPGVLSMMSTLDHSIYYYDDNFDCGDWLLYVVESPRAGSGRSVVHGRFYTQNGILVAVTSQEGLIRADIRGPEQATDANLKAKL